jgi:Na+/proline symporter
MFDAMTPNDPHWFDTSDTRASDRAAVRYEFAMMAIVIVFTIAAVIGLATAFPPGPDELSPWSVQPMPML